MDMKKVSTAIIVAAASMSAVMAAGSPAPSPSAGGSIPSSSPGSATASGPDSSVAAATLPVLGSLVGASIVTLFSYMLHVSFISGAFNNPFIRHGHEEGLHRHHCCCRLNERRHGCRCTISCPFSRWF
ncbi:hypothetical protein Gotur_010907 [Gossypium turneri]